MNDKKKRRSQVLKQRKETNGNWETQYADVLKASLGKNGYENLDRRLESKTCFEKMKLAKEHQ